jgi:hypothetical protein
MECLRDFAHEQYQNAMIQNAQLKSLVSAQKTILDDLCLCPDAELQAKLAIAAETLEHIESSLASSGNYLQSIIFSQSEDLKSKPSIGLKEVIPDIQRQILSICLNGIQQEMLSVPITAIYDLEQQLYFMEDSMEEAGSFSENATDRVARMNQREGHTRRVMEFLGAVHRNEIQPVSEE